MRQDGTVVTWGADWNGQCSLPSNLSDVIAVGGGDNHSLALVAGGAPGRGLLNPWRQAGRFSALIQSLNRKSYALEYKNSVSASNWTATGTNSGNGALRVLTDPAATGAQRFYRVRQW